MINFEISSLSHLLQIIARYLACQYSANLLHLMYLGIILVPLTLQYSVLFEVSLLRKGQSIGGLGEQELYPDTLDAIDSQNIDTQDSALLFEEDEIDLKSQNLSNDWDELEDVYESENKEV